MPTLSDLPLLGQARVDKLNQVGIKTLEQLVEADIAELQTHPIFERDFKFLEKQMPLIQGFAAANARNEPIVLAADPRIFKLKEPIIHVDLEFDGPANQIFLWGLLRHDQDKADSWFATDRKGQKAMLERFIRLCKEEDPTIVTWGGATSDEIQIRNACQMYKLDTKWMKRVRWFDLQTEVVHTGSPELQRIYLPVLKFKSDKVAAYFGYEKPPLAVKDGYTALKTYRKLRKRMDEGKKQDLIVYNAEDILHTKLILDGLRDLMEPHL